MASTILGACSSTTDRVTAAATEGPPLTVVGDSLTVLGGRLIRETLVEAGWTVRLDAIQGRTTRDQIPALRYASSDPDRTVIIELGTNDSIQMTDGRLRREQVYASIGQALDLFGDRCVVWMLPDRDPKREGAMGGAAFAEAMAAQATVRPNLHVADFGALLDQRPELLVDDQIHLTDEGYQALADLMASAVAACR